PRWERRGTSMTTSRRFATVAAVGLVSAAIGLGSVFVNGQTRPDPSPGGQPLTIFDREGKVVGTVGEPGSYSQPAFSPDGTRVAVAKVDPATQTTDIWVVTLPAGQSRRISVDPAPDTEPVWSPDGTQVAFISRRTGTWNLYRAPSNGEAREELLYRHAGFGGISNLGWSADARVLTFSDLINISGAMYVLPLDGSGIAKEVLRPPLFNARISPDGRVIAYPSNLSGRPEIYIRPFDSSSPVAVPGPGEPWQVSRDAATAGAMWRQDG